MATFLKKRIQPAAGAHNGERSAAAIEQENTACLVIVVTFLLIFIMAARTPLDTDMWWHLRAGEEMIRTGRVLLGDVFSFTRAGAHWINPYWLADSGLALIFGWQGYLGLGAAVALCAVASMALVYAQCEGPVFLKAAALLFGSVVASVVWSPRPQILSLVWLALVGFLLYQYKWRGRDFLWALPLVFVLWANTHPGYPLGLILIAAILAGGTFNHVMGIQSGPVLSWRQIARLGLWAIACGLAVLINPNGMDIWRLPFLTVDMRVLQQFIPEWASPNFHEIIEQSVLWLLLAVFVAVSLSGRRMDGSDLATILIFASMALLARRNFGPFAVVAVPVFSRYAWAAAQAWRESAPWLEKLTRNKPLEQVESHEERSVSLRAKRSNLRSWWRLLRFARNDRLSNEVHPPTGTRLVKKIINLAIVAVLGLVAVGKLYVVTQPALVGHYLVEGYPTRAAAWLEANHPGGRRMLNEYNWGGYLQWALPGFPTFVDGRTDLFGDAVIGEWIEAVQAGPGWADVFRRYPIDLVMLYPDRPLLKELREAGWKLLYEDSQAVIYGK